MNQETLKSIVERAETVDVLGEDVKPLIFAAAELGFPAYYFAIEILNKRGVKKHVLDSYGNLCRDFHSRVVNERQRQEGRPADRPDYLAEALERHL